MAYWLEIFLKVTPWMAWFFVGIGLPWSLALLPRVDWKDRTMVVGLALALGPLFGSTWLFALGTFSQFSFSSALAGTILLALSGSLIAWQRREAIEAPPPENKGPVLPELTIALVSMMIIGFIAMTWDTAFWPFLRYDTLWTFGYNVKIFMLESRIPESIDYYPQLVPLTFTFGTLSLGEYNDHAARAAVPWFILSGTFAAYLTGWRVYQKRIVGLITAALWLMLPSTLVWASSGDLEHPMAIYFTLATLFFILAWRASIQQNMPAATRYAIVAGLMGGGAMWIKPTGGAYALGVILVTVCTTIYALLKEDKHWFLDRFRIIFITGLATIPIGGMWYLRNLLVGREWTQLPPSYWQEFAQRSGFQLGWVWLVALLATISLWVRLWQQDNSRLTTMFFTLTGLLTGITGGLSIIWNFRYGFLPFNNFNYSLTGILLILFGTVLFAAGSYRHWRQQWFIEFTLAVAGMAMMSIAIIPTARSLPAGDWTWQTTWDWINGFREANRPLSRREVVLFITGALLLIWCGRKAWQEQPAATRNGTILMWGIGLPFFAVWFWSFSYHYRLVITVLPLLFATIAALLTGGVISLMTRNYLRRAALVIIAIMLCLPAPVAAAWHTWHYTVYGYQTLLEDDDSKYAYANPGLMQLVRFLRGYAETHNIDHLRILIPGENRLAFYFPEWHIEDSHQAIPADIQDLKDYDLYILFNHEFLWEVYDKNFTQVAFWTDMAWAYPLPAWDAEYAPDGPYGAPMRRLLTPISPVIDDQASRYEIFAIDLDAAYLEITPENPLDNVVFGDAIQLIGYDLQVMSDNPQNISFFQKALRHTGNINEITGGDQIELKLYWKGTENAPPSQDYAVYIHLINPETGQILSQLDGPFTAGVHLFNYQIITYPTRFLTPGEVFQDRRIWILPADLPAEKAQIRIGIYEPQPPWPRLPVYDNGEQSGDGFVIESDISIE